MSENQQPVPTTPLDFAPPVPPEIPPSETTSQVYAVPVPSSGGVPGIEAVGLRRFFGQVPAVVDISFQAPRGQITGLVGPNGAGKTTLLLMLAGLLKPDAGQIQIAGINMATDPTRARSLIGWMPDVFGTWDALTCLEILSTFGQAYGMDAKTAKDRSLEWLDRVHLFEYANQAARVLSRGQKQRLGLARAMIHDPQVVLLDEPASGLDPRSRVELRDLLKALAGMGKTILISSHVLSELEEMSDQAVFVSKGYTVAVPDETEFGHAARDWRLQGLDQHKLLEFLTAHPYPWRIGQDHAEFFVRLPSDEDAAVLLKEAAVADIGLYSIAPATGRLEEIYLSLDDTRR
jgi:ABC-type multidrug transport system ATPase subunit